MRVSGVCDFISRCRTQSSTPCSSLCALTMISASASSAALADPLSSSTVEWDTYTARKFDQAKQCVCRCLCVRVCVRMRVSVRACDDEHA